MNRFAVSLWRYAGCEEELKSLQKMLDEILQRMRNPVPLAAILGEMVIHAEIHGDILPFKEYSVSAQTAEEVLRDAQQLLDNLGIEQPVADVALVDDPSVQCARYVDE